MPRERVLCAGPWLGLHMGRRRGRGACLPWGAGGASRVTPRGRGMEQHSGGGCPPQGLLSGSAGLYPRGHTCEITLWGTLSPLGTRVRKTCPHTCPHRTSCVAVRRGRKPRQKAYGAATSGDCPSCVTWGTFFPFSMLSSLCDFLYGCCEKLSEGTDRAPLPTASP